jgi:hypothetical protein
MDRLIIKRLFGEEKRSDLTEWKTLLYKLQHPQREVTI